MAVTGLRGAVTPGAVITALPLVVGVALALGFLKRRRFLVAALVVVAWLAGPLALSVHTASDLRAGRVSSWTSRLRLSLRSTRRSSTTPGEKIASVHALHRASASIHHVEGVHPPQETADKPILGGLLAIRSGWTEMDGKAATAALTGLAGEHRIDIGVALDALAFNITKDGKITYSGPGMPLI